MKIENFLQDIKSDNLKWLFDYHSLDEEEENIDDLIDLDEETEENKKLISQMNWLFTTTDSTYYLIGLFDNKMHFIDTEGFFECSDYDIYHLPFLLRNLIDHPEYWENNRLKIEFFLYYFEYCKENNIQLLPEYLAWKQPFLEFINNN